MSDGTSADYTRCRTAVSWMTRLRTNSAACDVTALTTARDRGTDQIDLQEIAGHIDSKTTFSCIRTTIALVKSPAHITNYCWATAIHQEYAPI